MCEMLNPNKGVLKSFIKKQIRRRRSNGYSDPTVAVHSHIRDSSLTRLKKSNSHGCVVTVLAWNMKCLGIRRKGGRVYRRLWQ